MTTYPDVEVALRAYLGDLGYAVTSTPSDLTSQLPVIRIARIGGNCDKFTEQDYPNVEIHAFTARDSTQPRAGHDLTTTIRSRMDAIEGVPVTGGGLLYQSEMISGPIERPWPDQNVTIVQTIYRVTTRGF